MHTVRIWEAIVVVSLGELGVPPWVGMFWAWGYRMGRFYF